MRGMKEGTSMEENTDSKRKIAPSVPANYISILQLQERWIKEKERKRKEEEEEEERRRKQQDQEHQRIEEALKKSEVKGKREDLDEKRFNRSNRKHWGWSSKKKELIDGGEARCVEKEETAAIRSERGEGAAPREEGLRKKKRGVRKRYDSKKKKNEDVAAVKADVVDECGSVVTESNTWMKDAKKSVGSCEKGVTDDATAVETQFEDLSIDTGEEREETKNLKAQKRSRNRNRLKQKSVRMPIGDTRMMVWVKKGENERAGDGTRNGV